MNVLIAYASTEGHTRKIAEFVRARLADQGHKVTAVDVRHEDVDPSGVERVFVAASLHVGRYQPAIVDFARRHRDGLAAKRATFLAVSLAAAGRDDADRAGLDKCVAAFARTSGWTPARVHHVAGAFRFSTYGFITAWMMRYIAWRHGLTVDPKRDLELTDWDALARAVDETVGDA